VVRAVGFSEVQRNMAMEVRVLRECYVLLLLDFLQAASLFISDIKAVIKWTVFCMQLCRLLCVYFAQTAVLCSCLAQTDVLCSSLVQTAVLCSCFAQIVPSLKCNQNAVL
jgi:hypothetical protein